MKKSKLIKIPVKVLKTTHEVSQDIKYKLFSEIHKVDDERVLVNTFYDRDCKPLLRVFIQENSFISYSFSVIKKDRWTKLESDKWFTSTLEKLLDMPWTWHKHYSTSCYSDRFITFDTRTLNRVKRFLKSKESTPGAMILNHQLGIREEALKKKYRDKEETKKMYFKQLKDLPKDFRKWVDNVAFQSSKYIFYKRVKSNLIEGYCTGCQSNVQLKAKKGEIKHGVKIKCPNCKRTVELRPRGIYKNFPSTNIRDWSSFAYIHKIDNGIAVRCFNAYMDYDNIYSPTLLYEEEARYFIKPEAKTMFRWEKGKDETLKWGWTFKRQKSFYPFNDYYLYNRNIKTVLKDTEYKYSRLWDLVKNVNRFNLVEFLLSYKVYSKQIEQLIIKKFYYYTAEALSDGGAYYYSGFKREYIQGNSIKEMLGIENNDIKFAANMNMSRNEIEILKRLRKYNRPIRKEDFKRCRELIKDHYLIESIGKLLKYTTLFKILRYATENINAYQEAIEANQYQRTNKVSIVDFLGDYRDYITAAKQLGWNIKSNSTLFPKNLKRSHDIAMKMIDRKAHREERHAIRNMYEEYYKKYSYSKYGMTIIVPKTAEEISKEGDALKHCVGTYITSVASKSCIILFIRNIDAIEKSFYTMEIGGDNIFQCRGLQNCSQTPKVKKFIEAFKKDIVLKNKKQIKKAS